jgi:hypothetical protein
MKRAGLLTLFGVGLLLSALACGLTSGIGPEQGDVPAETSRVSPTSPAPTSDQALEESSPPENLKHLEGITLLTPTAGGGIRPTLEWEGVEGADRYGVYLYDQEGKLYWSWQGRETSIPVGGKPRLEEDALGPQVSDGMSWTVIAFDADQAPLAAGGPRAIAP